MRVVFADHVADHARRLHRLGPGHQSEFAHGKEHAALYRLLPVLHIRQGTPLDHGHGVFEVVAGSGLVQQDAVVFV